MANNTDRDFLIFILVLVAAVVAYRFYKYSDTMEHSRDYYRGSMPHY